MSQKEANKRARKCAIKTTNSKKKECILKEIAI